MSPWCVKRLEEFGGDISRFRMVEYSLRGCARLLSPRPSRGTRTIRTFLRLAGKVDIRKLESYSQNDPDAYSYSGGLNRANQGLLEFVEMFKAPIKMLHPC